MQPHFANAHLNSDWPWGLAAGPVSLPVGSDQFRAVQERLQATLQATSQLLSSCKAGYRTALPHRAVPAPQRPVTCTLPARGCAPRPTLRMRTGISDDGHENMSGERSAPVAPSSQRRSMRRACRPPRGQPGRRKAREGETAARRWPRCGPPRPARSKWKKGPGRLVRLASVQRIN